MVSKIIGGAIFILGLLITVGFPNIGGPSGYQPWSFSWAGILIGIVLMGVGLWILKFG